VKANKQKMSENKKVVLAFSGGLDTTYCLYDLIQQGYQVYTVFADSGGISDGQIKQIKQKALSMGSSKHYTIDVKTKVWDDFVLPLIWSHARINNEYPLLCSDRYMIVQICLQLCDELNTKNFAHGCTAMGNDQMRFDQTVKSLGNYNIIAPIRQLQSHINHVRDYEIKVLSEAGIGVPQQHQSYSINENMLGVTISGGAIDEFQKPNSDSHLWVKNRDKWPNKSLELQIVFEKGVPVAINTEKSSGVEILKSLNQQLGEYGIGRHIYTGDVSIGIKGRIVFECPGIDALLMAHQALANAVNSKFQNQFNPIISQRWADLVYNGFYHDPHRLDLETYLASSQSHVSGIVTLTTEGGSLLASAIESPHIVKGESTVYAQSCDWTPADAKGFILLSGQSTTLINSVRRRTSYVS
jgi:argininosuccinate synthase